MELFAISFIATLALFGGIIGHAAYKDMKEEEKRLEKEKEEKEAKEKKARNSPYLKSRRNRALAGIIALVIKSDKVISLDEIDQALAYIKRYYTGSDYKEIIRLLKISLKINNEKFVKQSCIWLRQTLVYSECIALVEFLYGIACASKNINKAEWGLLYSIMDRLGLESDDIDYLSRKYSVFYVQEKVQRQSASATTELSVEGSSREAQVANAYRLLGLDFGATADEVKSAFRRLARKYHPDTVQDEELKNVLSEKFKEISMAYKLLTE